MILLFIDHDVSDVIVKGVIDHFGEVELIRVREVGLDEANDDVLLDWAAERGRVMVSSDANTMINAAYQRIKAGLPFPGLIVVRQSLDFRIAIEDLAAIALCNEPDELADKVTYLPLVM